MIMEQINAGGWVVIIGAVFLGLTQIVSLILQHLARKTANKIHTLVNSNMAVQLQLNAVLARRMANKTKDPDDEKAAIISEEALRKHQAQQGIIDDSPK